MIPDTINKIVFWSYDEKARYLLGCNNTDKYIKNFIAQTEAMMLSKSDCKKTIDSYINKLKFINECAIDDILDKNTDLGENVVKFLTKTLLCFVDSKKIELERGLCKHYNIEFNDIAFKQSEDAVLAQVNGQEYVVNIAEGYIYVSYISDILAREDIMQKMIDYIGYCIERND